MGVVWRGRMVVKREEEDEEEEEGGSGGDGDAGSSAGVRLEAAVGSARAQRATWHTRACFHIMYTSSSLYL